MRQDYYADQTNVDWTDPLNPACYPQYWDAESSATLDGPLFLDLRHAQQLTPHIVVVPDNANYIVRPRGSFEQRVSIAPGSVLWGIAAYSKAAAGFTLQIIDLSTGSSLYSQPTSAANVGGTQPGRPGPASRVALLSEPFVIPPPGLITIQITNSDPGPADNELQVALYFAVPLGAGYYPDSAYSIPAAHLGPPNQSNANLAAEIPARLAALRDTTGYSTTASNATTIGGTDTTAGPPYLVMPANGRPFLYSQTIHAPAPGTTDTPVVSFEVPAGFSAAVRKIRNIYTGPNFQPGALIWRIQIDGASPPGFDAITDELGRGNYEELSGPIIAAAGSTVRYTVTVDPAAVLPEDTQCSLAGYLYPQGS